VVQEQILEAGLGDVNVRQFRADSRCKRGYLGDQRSAAVGVDVGAGGIERTHFTNSGQRLQTLEDVGLGYIKIGQSAVTLSGGEAQRMKLAKELSKRQTGRTLYLLDEPTTGLHFEDVSKLLEVIHRLTDLGNSVIIIEHNMDVIRNADWLIDLGPEGGEEGGRLVAQGTPDHVSKIKKSYTGQALSDYLRHTRK